MTEYERDGYVFLQGALTSERVGELNANIARYIQDIVPALPKEHVFYEDKDRPETLKQLQQMQEHDAYFGEFSKATHTEIPCYNPAVAFVVSALAAPYRQKFRVFSGKANIPASHSCR